MKIAPVLVLLLACGGTDNGGAVDASTGTDAPPIIIFDAPPVQADAPVTAGCSVTLSDAVTGTFACSVTAGQTSGENVSVFGLTAAGGGVDALIFSAEIMGTLTVGPHIGDVTEAAVSVTVGNDLYVATKGAANVGTIGSIIITSLTPMPVGGNTVWTVHGSATAMLVSLTNPSARITLSATF